MDYSRKEKAGQSLDEDSFIRENRFALAFHFHEAGLGGEIGIAGAFELTALLYGVCAENFAKQVVAGFPFAGAFAPGVVLVGKGAIGIIGYKTVAIASGILECFSYYGGLNFRGAELADGLRHRFCACPSIAIDEANAFWARRTAGQPQGDCSQAHKTSGFSGQFQARYRPRFTPCATA